MENMTGLSVGANFSAIISKPSAAVVGTSTLLCPNLSAIKPIAGCASIPTTWILAINSPMTIADIDWSSSRYTGRNAIIAPCPMLRSAVVSTSACIPLRRSSLNNEVK